MRQGLGLDFQASHRHPVGSWLLLAAGLAAAGWAAWAYLAAAEQRTELRARQAQLRQQQRPAAQRLARPDPAADLAARQAATQQATRQAALAQLDLPWGGLLASLQATRPAHIGLVELEADGRRGQFSITAEARDYPAMIDYYRRLQDTAGLADVMLAQHGVREDAAAAPVRFVLRGRWGRIPGGESR